MSPLAILITFSLYTLFIFIISWWTSRKADNESYFIGNRKSPWFVVAYGMIGASLSGVTFISVPGWVGTTHFTYFVIVLGYVAGYAVVSTILLPVYYKLNLTSIYTYLGTRFGRASYKTGSSFFLLSRIIGASFRMFLVVSVLQLFVFDHYGVPFWVTVILFMFLIQLYTLKGGIKTIVWTDTLQTTFMLLAVVLTVGIIIHAMHTSLGEMWTRVWHSDYSQIFVTDVKSSQYFVKLFISGMFITIAMTGLDQDMMQKNLSCRNLKDAKKNMTTLSLILVPVNFIFLFLGAVLYFYAAHLHLDTSGLTDHLFPKIALNYLGVAGGLVFTIGLIAAAYSSADSALTALTTTLTIDILELDKRYADRQEILRKKREQLHFLMMLIIIFVIILFKLINNEAIIAQLFTFAGYTYGPLLGLFSFGLFTRIPVKDKWVPFVAVLSPFIGYGLTKLLQLIFSGYQTGFEILLINGLITFIGLLIIKNPSKTKTHGNI
ncbi:sodium:solute symporter [Candidatus Sulfidibacterium hydrothermale]|uniref:sodium:solute symporter n=1 Tax=Candidatus Sulfidibacterium hydrothermale TaxID=2875962 RepID=UPI001F0A7B99|nr:sodium:solute symporter [Candidatus Sulfidibacterium hydrothermale]UBM61930.1 sodium:solute symporter [Candidatus Sulfidibacterium hydrothermale]